MKAKQATKKKWGTVHNRLNPRRRIVALVIIVAVAILGITLIFASHAATPVTSIIASQGTASGPITSVSNGSGGSAVQFGAEASTSSPYPPVFGSASAPTGYTNEIYDDEFNNGSLSGWNTLDKSNNGSSDHEDECYMSSDVAVKTLPNGMGVMQLTAEDHRTSPVTGCGANPDLKNSTSPDDYFFTSGFATTRYVNTTEPQTFAFTQGYTEASIQMPKGNPYWADFWLVGATGAPAWPDYGEFDVVEWHGIYPDGPTGDIHYPGNCSGNNCSNNGFNVYNIVTGTNSNSNKGSQLLPTNFFDSITNTQFIRYGLLWKADSITFYINGIPLRTVNEDGTQDSYSYTDTNGAITVTGQTVHTLTPSDPNYPFSKIFGYAHTIDLSLSVGGGPPSSGGYTGNESVNPTTGAASYSNGNFAATTPGEMNVDYVRVYQP